MYHHFFGLSGAAFGPLGDARNIFLAETHREAYATLVYGITARQPVIVVTGEVGLGKTTVLRAALASLATERIRVAEPAIPLLSPDAFIRFIGSQLGMLGAELLAVSDIDRVHAHLLRTVATQGRLLLVIDEAQALPAPTLEFLRLISNLAASLSGELQMVLVGQPELWETLQRREFQSFRTRVSIRATLQPLGMDDAREYLDYRLQLVGGRLEQIITPAALRRLLRAAGGVPRRINVVMDNALLTGFGAATRPITPAIVREALETVDGDMRGRRSYRRRLRLALPAGVALAAGAAVAVGAAYRAGGLEALPLPQRPVAPAQAETDPRPDAQVDTSEGPPAAMPATASSAADQDQEPPRETAVSSPGAVAPQPERYVRADQRALIDVVAAAPSELAARSAGAAAPRERETLADSVPYLIHEMRAGETIGTLLTKNYGRNDVSARALFLALNPDISDLNAIPYGKTVRVPVDR